MALSGRAAGFFGSSFVLLLHATLAGISPADSFELEFAPFEGEGLPGGLGPDCLLSAYDTCSGYLWVWTDDPGAVWGIVQDPNTCPGGCMNGGAVSEVYVYGRCSSVPGAIGGVSVETVDSQSCPVTLLYRSGPMTMTHCVSGDRWTVVPVPLTHVFGNPFVLTIEWGPGANPRLATDNALANLYCQHGFGGFPGCAAWTDTCVGWSNLPQVSYIYVTDIDHNGTLEDLCALYGAPYGLSFPYGYPYGYLHNNLLLVVGLDCNSPTAVESTSWGHVKALFQ